MRRPVRSWELSRPSTLARPPRRGPRTRTGGRPEAVSQAAPSSREGAGDHADGPPAQRALGRELGLAGEEGGYRARTCACRAPTRRRKARRPPRFARRRSRSAPLIAMASPRSSTAAPSARATPRAAGNRPTGSASGGPIRPFAARGEEGAGRLPAAWSSWRPERGLAARSHDTRSISSWITSATASRVASFGRYEELRAGRVGASALGLQGSEAWPPGRRRRGGASRRRAASPPVRAAAVAGET